MFAIVRAGVVMRLGSLVRGAGFVFAFIAAASALTCLTAFAFSGSLFKVNNSPKSIAGTSQGETVELSEPSGDIAHEPDYISVKSGSSEGIGYPFYLAVTDELSPDDEKLMDELKNAEDLYATIADSRQIAIDPAVFGDPEYSYDNLVTAAEPEKPAQTSNEYDFSSPVPASDPVEDKWFEDALFIGDSRTVGMMNYSGVKAYYYCKVGLNIRGVLTNPIVEDGDEELTIIQTIEKYPVFKKVYISFGLNELGWDSRVFINTYSHVLENIRKLLPDAQIYVQAVIPVSAEASEKNQYGVNNEAIVNYNALLAKMCADNGYFYIDMDVPFTAEDGTLSVESADGIHLGGAAVRSQFDYLRSHTVRTGDYVWTK